MRSDPEEQEGVTNELVEEVDTDEVDYYEGVEYYGGASGYYEDGFEIEPYAEEEA